MNKSSQKNMNRSVTEISEANKTVDVLSELINNHKFKYIIFGCNNDEPAKLHRRLYFLP